MRIRALTHIAGRDFELAPGQETDRFGEAEAIRLIERGYAAPVGEVPIEAAIKTPPAETRTRSRRKGKAG